MELNIGEFGQLESEKKAIWLSRSIRHKLAHRFNVASAFILGRVTFHSFWHGLRYAHTIKALAAKAPNLGLIPVCPELIEDLIFIEQR